MDFKAEIEKMRHNFEENRPTKLHLHRPWWMFVDEDLSKIYTDKETLLTQGKVYYACLLQANSKLFRRFPPFDYPAQILYSMDPAVDENPLVLENITDRLYLYKYSEDDPPAEWSALVANMKDEKDRTSFWVDCALDSHMVKAKMQTIMVYRKHLPTKVLQGRILPVVACPDACDSVLILPASYWSEAFTAYWLSE